MSRVHAQNMNGTWEMVGTEQILKDIKNKIREEIKFRELRKNATV